MTMEMGGPLDDGGITPAADPFALFATWMAEAEKSEPNDANAMALATADETGQPNVRMVLLKGVDARGFVFYSNATSIKGGELAANPRVALVVDDYDEDWTRLAYLLLHMDAAPVEDDVEYAEALAALCARYPAYRAMPLARDTHPMIRLTPRRWHLWHAGGAPR